MHLQMSNLENNEMLILDKLRNFDSTGVTCLTSTLRHDFVLGKAERAQQHKTWKLVYIVKSLPLSLKERRINHRQNSMHFDLRFRL